ncbi:MAG: DNA-binding response regulator [Thermus sp.]
MRVLIADDHPLFLLGLKAGLEAEGMEVVAMAKDGEEALAMALKLNPEAVLLDLKMPHLDGLACCRRLREEGYTGLIAFLTTYLEPALLLEAHLAGADGYFSKELSALEIREKLRRLLAGEERFVPPELPHLTPREKEALRLLAQGLSAKEMARALGVSPETVKDYLEKIYAKLEAKNRVEAVAKARRLGLL